MGQSVWWILGLAALATSGVHAGQADGEATLAPSTPAFGTSADTPQVASHPLTPADEAFRGSINALHQERELAIHSFDWNRSTDPVQLQKEYTLLMKGLDIRELELKRDWYQASGQSELLARVQASLDRLTQPRTIHPEISVDHEAVKQAMDATKEVQP